MTVDVPRPVLKDTTALAVDIATQREFVWQKLIT